MPELISPLELTQEEAPPETAEGGDHLEAVRELVLRAHPDVVPELIGGATVADLIASVEPAREAYARLAAGWQATQVPAREAVAVPAGGGSALPVDPAMLPAAEKIRRGLKASPAAPGREG